MKYRVAVYCDKCGAEYRTRAIEGKKPPKRCKECKSSKIQVHPRPEESTELQIELQFIPVPEE